jgi:hypothetical protein
MKHSLGTQRMAIQKVRADILNGHITGSKSQREYIEDVLATIELRIEQAIEKQREATNGQR